MMRMTGMNMPAHGWMGTYAVFVAQWVGMMAAMMLPSLLPRLWAYGRVARLAGWVRATTLIGVAGVGYLVMWAVLAALVFPMNLATSALLARVPLLARAAPVLVGTALTIAGALQLGEWKARHLTCWQSTHIPAGRACSASDAWRYGMKLGVHCVCCGAGLAAALLVLGAMDLRIMVAATVAVTLERSTPHGLRVARSLGVIGVVTGGTMIMLAVMAR